MNPRLNIELTLEQQLLLSVARFNDSWPDASIFEALSSNSVNWDSLVEAARLYRLSGLLHLRLRHPDVKALVPDKALQSIQRDYLRIRMLNIYLDTDLRRVLSALNSEQIPAILLKGAALQKTTYDDSGARPMADIDLLVPDSLARRAQDTVISLGFSQDYATEVLAHAEEIGRHLPRLQSENGRTAVEVHRHLVSTDSPIQFDIDGLWERSVRFEVDDIPCKILSVEDQLIHLGLNFMHDRRFGANASLGQLADIAAIVGHEDVKIDWTLVNRLMNEYALNGFVGCTFELANALLHAPIPECVRLRSSEKGTIASFNDEQLSRLIRTRIFPSSHFFATVLDTHDDGETSASGATSIWRRLFPSRRYLIGKYGEPARGVFGTRFYAVRLWAGIRLMAELARHPKDWNDNLIVDRWIRSLSKS